jgi:hypothetical protein
MKSGRIKWVGQSANWGEEERVEVIVRKDRRKEAIRKIKFWVG